LFLLLLSAVLLSVGVQAVVLAQDTVEPFAVTDPATGAKPFEGQELRIMNTEVVPVLSYEHEVLDPMYEEASGVHLVYENAAYDGVLSRLQTMCAAGGDDYDIFFAEDGWVGSLEALGCLQELTPYYLAAPGQSHPEDYTRRAFGTVAMHNDKWYAIPTLIAVGMFAYRTDLFNDPEEKAAFEAEYGRELTVPQTWQELLEVGKFFTRPDEDLYGYNYRYGAPNNALFDYMIHFAFSRGVNFFDAEFNPLFDSEAAIDAANMFTGQEFLANQPPGRESFQFGEILQNFTQGRVAMMGTESWAIPLLLDPSASTVAANTSFAEIPGWQDPATGEIHRQLLSAGPGYFINANISPERKQLAWDYLQLTFGPDFEKVMADQHGVAHRRSTLTDPTLVEKYPFFPFLLGAMEVGIGRPSEPWWPEAENAIGSALQDAVAGRPVEEALAEANQEIHDIVDEAGYYDGTHHYVQVEEREQFVCAKFAELGLEQEQCAADS
jgi:multiple sugar transport system substrate-binding protein